MRVRSLDFKGHNFNAGQCVCGLTREQYDDRGQPSCAGPKPAARQPLPPMPPEIPEDEP
jgi:hypothetical protein